MSNKWELTKGGTELDWGPVGTKWWVCCWDDHINHHIDPTLPKHSYPENDKNVPILVRVGKDFKSYGFFLRIPSAFKSVYKEEFGDFPRGLFLNPIDIWARMKADNIPDAPNIEMYFENPPWVGAAVKTE